MTPPQPSRVQDVLLSEPQPRCKDWTMRLDQETLEELNVIKKAFQSGKTKIYAKKHMAKLILEKFPEIIVGQRSLEIWLSS